MKTSSYDEPCEDEDPGTEYLTEVTASYCASENHEAPDAPSYEVSVDQGHEASFAKCKVPVAANVETPVEDYSAAFAKCSLQPVVESYETPVTESYEAPTATSYQASFAKCSLPAVIESCETSTTENFATPLTENYEAPAVESNEAQVANVTPQSSYTPNVPPPVPKRTLLPSKASKEPTLAPEKPQEISVVTEEADTQNVAYRDIELVSPEEVAHKTETGAERWSDSTSVSLPGQVEDVETVSSDPGNAQCEPVSEMYYTASSEVSLLSDTELADKVQTEEDESKDDRKNVISGHVAAMRERFESMTRTNTPCPDLIRSLSPSLEVFRNMSPSPDRLA